MQLFNLQRTPNLTDEENKRVARALHSVQLILVGAALLLLPVLLYSSMLYPAFGLLVGMALILFTIWLNQHGQAQIASLLVLSTVLVVITFSLWFGNGIHDVVIVAYPLVLIIAGLLLNRRMYLMTSALVIISSELIIYAEIRGWIQTPFTVITNYSDMLIVSAILATIGLIIRMLSNSLFSSLESSRLSADQQKRLALETHRQAEQLTILNRVSIAVASGLELEQVLVELYQQLKGVVSLDSFYVAMVDRQANLVTFPIFISAGERISLPREKLDSGSGLTGEVIRTRRTLYIPDVVDPAISDKHEVLQVGPGETRAYIGIPMHLHGEVMGVLSVQSEHPHAYTNDQISMLQTIASQVSVAIDNARLFVEVMDALHREERVNQLAHLISGAVDLQFILESVVGISVELLGAEAGTLNLVTSDQSQLNQIYNHNLPAELSELHRLKGRGLTWEIITGQCTIHLHEYSQHAKALPELVQAGYHAYLGVPILAGEQCLGSLSLLSRDPLKRFQDRERALLEAIGRLAGSVIQNARLFAALQAELEERRRVEAALTQRDAILESAAYAAESFMKASDWRGSIQLLLEKLGTGTCASHAYLYQTHRDAAGGLFFSMIYEWVAPGALQDLNDPFYQNVPLDQMGSQEWINCMKSGAPFFISTQTTDPVELQYLSLFNIKAYLDMPVYNGEDLWGYIGFDDENVERTWTDAEVDSLKVAAGVLGAAVLRQQADQAIRQLNAELEQRVRQRTADLESAYQELEAFAYSVSHDLRTPLRGIDGYSQLLLEDYTTTIDEEGRLYLDNVRKATRQMSQLIDDILKLSRVTRLELHHEMIDLSSLASSLADEWQRRESTRQVIFKIMPGLQAYGDPSLLRLVMENLLSNAWKFTGKTEHALIEIGQLDKGQEQVFFVRDNGVGFDMKYYDKLFRAFQRLHSPSEFEGTGVGLATVQRIIQRHSGRIWAESALGRGASFYFTLPAP